MIVKDIKSKKVLFVVDEELKLNQRFGFNFDNAPNIYAIYTVLKIKDNVVYVGEPEHIEREFWV
jgi:hypothetical protein